MSAAASAATAVIAVNGVRHVFAAAAGIEPPAARIAALIDPAFLAEVGWDPTALVLAPPPTHRLLGRPERCG